MWNDYIYEIDGTLVNDTLINGVCTRTHDGMLGSSGAGSCTFNFVDRIGTYTMAVQGYMDTRSDGKPSALAVTGGSGAYVSLVGEMYVTPVDDQGFFTTADIFTGVTAYVVEAAFGIILCPPVPLVL